MKKRVLITGGNRGIGGAITTAMLADGWHVITASRTATATQGLDSYSLDLSDLTAVPGVIERIQTEIGTIDCLIANAGMTNDMLLLRAEADDVEEVLRVNLTASIMLAKSVLKGMIKQRWGRIIFVGSVVALSGSAGQVAYSASKAGLVGAARSLAREVGSRGITVNLIAPGFIETDMTAKLPVSAREQAKALTPLGRLGLAADVGGVAAFLASDEASFITGAVVPVDGGLGMGN